MSQQDRGPGPNLGYQPQVVVPTAAKNAGSPIQPKPPAPRVAVVGASLLQHITPGRYQPYQRQQRVLGDASLYNTDLSTQRPFQFSLGNFEVPGTSAVILTEVELRVFTFSGIAATDSVEVDPGNLTTQLAFSLTVGNERKPYNALSDIVPVLFAVGTRNQSVPFYAVAAANQLSTSGQGNGLLPFDGERPGPISGPVSVVIQPQEKTFEGLCYVFRQLPIPVKFFQFKLAGYITDQSTAQELLANIVTLPSAPCLVLSPLDATGTENPGAPSQTPSRSAEVGRVRGPTRIPMHGIENITGKWGRSLIFTKPSGHDAIVYETDLSSPLPMSEGKFVLAAKGVTEGMAKAGYSFDAYGVLTEGHRLQVVLRLAEVTFAGSLLKVSAAVKEKLAEVGIEAVGEPRVWEITDTEGRFFSEEGGVAPMFINRGGKVSTTKAAVEPNPKQLLVGDVQNLASAVTIPTATRPSVPIDLGVDMMSLVARLALAAGVAAVTYFAAKPAFQDMARNGRRRKV